ncbi:tryptophan synthase subunit alpha [Puniceicoccales bacterium CK1056]|uniref:Tryptophan synthase alpha chain n=1 Tax=Oceanipulchritudo coccoides TaxID=2706888 RepID=A0A6B2M0M5_9BACT|nr:tryptophan synthase subunit alpha [Oceanipulchritudo coccoides]NDV61869.1 tryptophan synthase subunit alpha [Oceanipulchritudo coccoides]
MNRIQHAFDSAKAENRAVFVAYVCAGDPDLESSLAVCCTLIEKGTDILELGVPFSDPLADGLTNQLAAERALASGMDQQKVFELIRRIREFSEVPIVLYTYYNLVFSQGLEAYAGQVSSAGADGVLTLDLPPEEAGEFEQVCDKAGVKTVYIIAPTTPEDRIRMICQHVTGFLYYVSQEGVTGERSEIATNLAEKLQLIQKHATQPVVVGFGISQPHHVRTVAAVADGVVVGSALVNCIAHNLGDQEAILSELGSKMEALRPGLVKE